MNEMIKANVALDILGIILSLIPIAYILGDRRYKQKSNRYFFGVALSNIFMIAGDLADWLIKDTSEPYAKVTLIVFSSLFYVASAFVLYFFARYINEYLKMERRPERLCMIFVSALCGIQIIFALISPFTGSVFYVTESGYQRGNLFIISQLVPLFCYVLFTVLIIIYRRKLSPREVGFFLLYIFVPLGGGAAQMLLRGIAVVNIGVALALLFILVNIQFEHEITMKRQEKELADLRIDIMLSQIQPHFLYNVLTGIRSLCETDPKRAGESIGAFSKFLRSNMDSLTTGTPILFEQELEHTRSYLHLEKQRFGNKLHVVYQIDAVHFSVPSLTLQPIAENAVRHGIMKKEKGGTITIHSYEAEHDFIIKVTDDGVGFNADDTMSSERTHLGLSNVKSRLEALCGGTLEIQSSPKVGTTVTISIPKER